MRWILLGLIAFFLAMILLQVGLLSAFFWTLLHGQWQSAIAFLLIDILVGWVTQSLAKALGEVVKR